MKQLTAEKLQDLAAALAELEEIYGFLGDLELARADFSVIFSEVTVDDEGDTSFDIEPFPCDREDAVDCEAVAWDAIVKAYFTRALVLENELRNAGVTDLPKMPKRV